MILRPVEVYGEIRSVPYSVKENSLYSWLYLEGRRYINLLEGFQAKDGQGG